MKAKNLLPIFATFLCHPVLAEAGEGWKRHTVAAAAPSDHLVGANGFGVADINNDGLTDVVLGWKEGNETRVYLHPGPEKVREVWPSITVGEVPSVQDAAFADLDQDGQLDVISACEGKSRTVFVHWATAEGEPAEKTSWSTAPFPATAGKAWWTCLVPYDVDRDGDMDLLLGSKNADAGITLLLNPEKEKAHQLSEWTDHPICNAKWIMSMRVFEQGGKSILAFSDRKGERSGIYFAPLLDKSPWVGEPVCIGASGEEVMRLDLAHLDDDQNYDIAVAIRPRTVRVYYQPENPFQEWEDWADLDLLPEDYGEVNAVTVGRIDEDDIPDFAISCERANGEKKGVLWADMFSEFSPISDTSGIQFERIKLIDLDGDGDLDLLTTEAREGLGLVWFENPSP